MIGKFQFLDPLRGLGREHTRNHTRHPANMN